MKKLKNIILALTLLTMQTLAQNTNPVVENVAFTINGTTVTITYDIKDAEQTSVTVQMFVSENSGVDWTDRTDEAAGDVGTVTGVTTTSTEKTITWTYSGGNSATMKIKIIANDETADGSPCPGTATVTYAGKTYNTIQIAGQCWLKENLDVGTMIQSTQYGSQQTDNSTIEKYCWDNIASNCDTYGGLYEWDEAMNYGSTGGQGICPNNWHIPSKAEFETLRDAAGGSSNALKAIGEGGGSGTGTNTSGFSGLLVGYRASSGGFSAFGYGLFWSNIGLSGHNAENVWLYPDTDDVVFNYFYRNQGLSIRCVKD